MVPAIVTLAPMHHSATAHLPISVRLLSLSPTLQRGSYHGSSPNASTHRARRYTHFESGQLVPTLSIIDLSR
jgi:hypothetical protein